MEKAIKARFVFCAHLMYAQNLEGHERIVQGFVNCTHFQIFCLCLCLSAKSNAFSLA